MPRNRVIYQCEAVYVGPTPATGGHWVTGASVDTYTGQFQTNSGVNLVRQLYRIQSANYDFGISRRDVNQYGELAAIDRIILEQPTVNLNFSYLLTSFINEKILGFSISSGNLVSAVSGIINKNQDDKNYFLKTHSEGQDAVQNASDAPYNVIAIGNGFISNYTSEAAVGDFPRCTVNVEALNMNFDSMATAPGVSITGFKLIPAVNPENGNAISTWYYDIPKTVSSTGLGISALRPGDVTLSMTYDDGGLKISDAKIQSYSLSYDLSRTPLLKLGSKFAFAREINFPANVTLSVTANVGDLSTGKLTEIVNNNRKYDITININQPGTSTTAVAYIVKQATLDSQSFSSSIGSDKSCTLNFTSQVSGPQATGIGIYMSGIV
jgi:hypothetical protein